MILTIFGIILLCIGGFVLFCGIKIRNSPSSSSGPLIAGGSPEMRALYRNNNPCSNTGTGPIIAGIVIIIIGIILLSV